MAVKLKIRKLTIQKSITGDDRLKYFRKMILAHLDTLERDNDAFMAKAKALPIGTIHEWGGVKYIKGADNKWRPKYDKDSRGVKIAISAIKKKIATAETAQNMMQIILLHRDRFQDKNGCPLPFVQELSDYIRKQSDAIDKTADNKKPVIIRDKNEIRNFINEALSTKEKKKANIGDLTKNVQEEIKRQTGITVKHIEIDQEHIRHASAPKHLLEPDDLLNSVEAINSFTSIKDTGKINHGSKVLEIKADINGEIFFIEGVHRKGEGFLTLITCYRQKKARQSSTGSKNPETNVQNDMPSASSKVSDELGKKSSDKRRSDADEHAKNAKETMVNKVKEALAMTDSELEKEYGYDNGDFGGKGYDIPITPSEYIHGKTPDKLREDAKNWLKENGIEYNELRKKSDFEKIQCKYQSAKSIEGDTDEVQIGKEELTGKWKLVEADTPTVSHDETSFNKTSGFPKNADGSSINDRDYEHFEANKDAVINAAGDFDGRALKFDNPVIVTTDGIVISGNNRTMSSKLAAKKGTDKKYIETLKKRAKKFGFTVEDIEGFKNPRVVFEVKQQGKYSTEQFAKFNESGKKEMGPTEKAAKISKMIKSDTIEAVARKIDEFDTIGELYQDTKASQEIYNIFKNTGLIGENEAGRYFENGTLTDDGKTFIETALLGTVINESNLRGFNRPGCKSIRSTLMRALIPLVENKGMDGYSINSELNTAIDITMQVAIEKDKFKNVDDFAKQQNMFETIDPVAVELAKKLEGTQKQFSDFMRTLNGGLKTSASGEIDIFLGEVESKEDILKRILKSNVLHKAIDKALDFFPWMRNMGKSLTYSGYPLQGRTKVQGMNISIENKKGSTRSGIDKDGHEWHTKMHFDYGYIRGTVGVDKDHLDVYVGPNPESETVFIVNQKDPITGKFDEQKVMLGFNSEQEAKNAYLKQYDRPGFFGNMIVMDIDTFKDKAFDVGNKGKPIENGGVLQKSIKKTIAIDFDGVINSYSSGWKGPTETDDPVKGAAEAIRELHGEGHKLIIFSVRANSPEGEKTIRDYLLSTTETPKLVEEIEITDKKPMADMYIDDMAITFTGNWNETLEKMKDFKSWAAQNNHIKKALSRDALIDNQEKERKKFEKLFYDFFKDDTGRIGLNGETLNNIRKLDRYPEGLSMENCGFLNIGKKDVTIAAGGDWQQEVFITLGVENGKIDIIDLYAGNKTRMNSHEISQRFKEIEEQYGSDRNISLKKSISNLDEEKLEYFRKLLLRHLEESTDEIMAKAKAFDIGHITTRKNGKRYKKVGPKKWVEVRDVSGSKKDETKTAKIKSSLEVAESVGEMMETVLANKDKFSDEKGNPISTVREMKEYTQQQGLESRKKKQSDDDDEQKSKAEKESDNNKPDGDEKVDNVIAKTFISPDQFNAAEWSRQWDDSKATPDEAGAEYILQSFGEKGQAIANGIRDADSKNRRIMDDNQLTHQLHRISGEGESARYTPEREKLHGEIMQKLLSPDKLRTALPPPGKKPKFIILGGRGGSGKSWFKNNLYDPNTTVILDADEIKSMIPEYKGWNANQVHEESGDILEQMISMCIRDGLNIVLDATMKTANSALAKVFRFKSAGYKTEAHYMHLPKQEAAKRAIGRFMGSPEKGKETEFTPFQGRYVPVTAVLKNTTNEDSFDQVRQYVDEWSFRDNNVKRGEQPILISEGKKDK